MKRFISRLAYSFMASCLLAGCSMLMPYKDEFRCNKGVGEGYCSSMSENYQEIQAKQSIPLKSKKTTLSQKEEEEVSCQKCEDMHEAIWLKQRERDKKYGIH